MSAGASRSPASPSSSSRARSWSRSSTTSSPARDPLNALLAAPAERPEGVALGVKDLFDTAGLVTTYGSALFAEHVPARSGEAVRRLETAGYGVVAKTNLHEFAYGITSQNPHYGDVRNPLDATRTPGGSSGGSAAALAAGLVDAALGTDSAGSIRIPAACCGVVGFKPTHGLVPMDGCFPLAPSFDTAGPLARDVAGCVAMMAALAPGIVPERRPVRVALAWLEEAAPGVRARVEAAAGHLPERAALAFPRPGDFYPLFMREVAGVHAGLFAEHAGRYGENVRRKVERCLRMGDAEAESARRLRERYREQALASLEGFDLLLVPTMGTVAPPASIPEADLRGPVLRFTGPFSALGWPVLALPCGPAELGLPASLSLVGRPGDDALVLGVGVELEAALAAR